MENRPKKRSSGGSRCGGFLLAELITGIALLGVILVGLMVSMNGFSMINDCQWARQRCTAAAQAQLESIATTGKPIEPQELQRLWPGVEVSVERSPGVALWDGFEQIQVMATTYAGPRKMTVRLARYVGRVSHSTGILPARSRGVPPMSITGVSPVRRCGIGILPMIHGQDAHATIHGRDAHATGWRKEGDPDA
jgi:hypothetical protein